MIRRIGASEIGALAKLQDAALPGSLPASFGDRFLALYYETLLADPEFFCDGFFWESQAVGFMAYSSNTRAALRRALRRRFGGFALAVSSGVVAHPSRIRKVLGILPTLLPSGGSAGDDVPAELISFGVRPEFRRSSPFHREHGISISHELIHRAFEVLASHGARAVKIFIKLEEEDAFIHRFYRREGFEPVTRVRRYGREFDLMVRPLGTSGPPSGGSGRV